MSASVYYNPDIVNSAVSSIQSINSNLDSISSSLKSISNQIVSAKGFQEYVGGLSVDTFSGYVEQCKEATTGLTTFIRNQQVRILAYGGDSDAIKSFLSGLNLQEFQKLDLSVLEGYGLVKADAWAEKMSTGFKSALGVAGLGFVEGLGNFAETAGDLVVLAGSLFASAFTKGYDILNGTNITEELWEGTRAFVSKKHVESAFDSSYENTKAGQYLKNNALFFDSVRGISSGLGYTAGVIGLNVVTGGLASGAIGAAGSISAVQLGATAGALGFARGTSDAWNDGATTGKGLLYGAANGVWEGTQWFLGAKINQFGGFGDKIAEGVEKTVASGLFKGAQVGVGSRIALDTIDSAAEGGVQPLLTMIYKDYGGDSFLENWKSAFQASGGWGNVVTQGVMGGIASFVGEYSGARKLLKEASSDAKASNLFKSSSPGAAAGVSLATLTDASDAGVRHVDFDVDGAMAFTGSRDIQYTIDGRLVNTSVDTIFNTKSCQVDTNKFRWFKDGTYLPVDGSTRGILEQTERNISCNQFSNIVEQCRDNLSADDYRSYKRAAQILRNNYADVNIDGLKLIVAHSEGNISRIKDALSMSYKNMPDDTIDQMAKEFAENLFSSKIGVASIMLDDMITTMQKNGTDNWKSSRDILKNMDMPSFQKLMNQSSTPVTEASIRKFFGGQISEETVQKLLKCDGYRLDIKQILDADSHIPKEMLDPVSASTAANLFKSKNLAGLKACCDVDTGHVGRALSLISNDGASWEGYSKLFKATNSFSQSSTRRLYYTVVDDMIDRGVSMKEAVTQARYMNANALESLGKDNSAMFRQATDLFDRKNKMYFWDTSVSDGLGNSPVSPAYSSDYLRRNYMDGNNLKANQLISDFEALRSRRKYELQTQHLTFDARHQRYDVYDSLKATDTFYQSYIDALNDANNPNRFEAARFMSKLLELDSQGQKIHIINDCGENGSWSGSNLINLGKNHYAGQAGTNIVGFHENGHTLFRFVLGEKVPDAYESAAAKSMSFLKNLDNSGKLEGLGNNMIEIEDYCQYQAKYQLDKALKSQGFSGTDGYLDYMTNKYSRMTAQQRMMDVERIVTDSGAIDKSSFAKAMGTMDFKDPRECAQEVVDKLTHNIYNQVKYSEFSDYTGTSGMIDSLTKGRVHYIRGHGINYYERDSKRSTISSYHELLADYTFLKVTGDNAAIRYLRSVLGDEIMNMVDSTYQAMLK